VPELLVDHRDFVGVMAVAITCRVGNQSVWEFWYAIDKDVVEVGQSSDGIGWVAGLMVWGVAEAAFWPWLMAFFDDL
jgi:hypothetical protein